MDRREESAGVYGELAENPESTALRAKATARVEKKGFRERDLANLLIDFANGDTFE